ncbi:hypothetical protein Hypma_014371 [Hypsizygus marmoreus]|uniref:Uncharacterized protein n=1 Tax=Hypsizygus marmoreus TaxID=39966 RepID=A0A369JHQ6_HYPMA|nr:hypothetical protein Hypma_014371 [Hypsizygus marmoreus]
MPPIRTHTKSDGPPPAILVVDDEEPPRPTQMVYENNEPFDLDSLLRFENFLKADRPRSPPYSRPAPKPKTDDSAVKLLARLHRFIDAFEARLKEKQRIVICGWKDCPHPDVVYEGGPLKGNNVPTVHSDGGAPFRLLYHMKQHMPTYPTKRYIECQWDSCGKSIRYDKLLLHLCEAHFPADFRLHCKHKGCSSIAYDEDSLDKHNRRVHSPWGRTYSLTDEEFYEEKKRREKEFDEWVRSIKSPTLRAALEENKG